MTQARFQRKNLQIAMKKKLISVTSGRLSLTNMQMRLRRLHAAFLLLQDAGIPLLRRDEEQFPEASENRGRSAGKPRRCRQGPGPVKHHGQRQPRDAPRRPEAFARGRGEAWPCLPVAAVLWLLPGSAEPLTLNHPTADATH